MLENYFYLFFDSLTAAVILPIRSESAIIAMKIFGNYNSVLIFSIALVSSCLGSLINFFIGRLLTNLKKTIFKNFSKEIAKAEVEWNNYVVWFLLFSSLKFLGNPLAIIAGFLNTDWKKFLTLVAIGKAGYYFYLIFLTS